jgi:hypothetical protein
MLVGEVDGSFQNHTGYQCSPGQPHETDGRGSQVPLRYQCNRTMSTELDVRSSHFQSHCKRSLLQRNEVDYRGPKRQCNDMEPIEVNGSTRRQPGFQHSPVPPPEMGCRRSQNHGSPMEPTGMFC